MSTINNFTQNIMCFMLFPDKWLGVPPGGHNEFLL